MACGQISQYNKKPEEKYGLKNTEKAFGPKRLLMQGFIVSRDGYWEKYQGELEERVGAWIADGSFTFKSWVTEGIDNAAKGLVDLYEGKHFGKAVLKVA